MEVEVLQRGAVVTAGDAALHRVGVEVGVVRVRVCVEVGRPPAGSAA